MNNAMEAIDSATRYGSARRTAVATIVGAALAATTMLAHTTAHAGVVLEFEQETRYSFGGDATFRRGPLSKIIQDTLGIAWSDHDTTSYLRLRNPQASQGANNPRAEVVSRVRTIGVNGVSAGDAGTFGDVGGLHHQNTVIDHRYKSLESVTLQVDGVIHALVGGTRVEADRFAFESDLFFLESDNSGRPCVFNDGTQCPDILFALEENLGGSREFVFDGRRYLHSTVVYERESKLTPRYSAEECDRVPGWNGRGACLGFVTPETGGKELSVGFQVAAVPEPLALGLVGTGLLASGCASRRRRGVRSE